MPKSENIDNCKFVLFTDKDGTLDLNDESLNKILMLTRKKGGLVIPVTGRTVGDIKEEWEAKKLPLPPIIIGDNGAVIYDTKKKKFIKKCELKKDKISHIIEKFIEIEGRTDLIRYTDGEKVYASKSEKVENYYESSGKVKFISNIENEVQKGKEVTKITLAGTKEQMEEMAKFIKEENLECWTDIGETKFPTKSSEDKKYRLDIVSMKARKGKAVDEVIRIIKPIKYMCFGNGNNDISMFKQAIDDGMYVAVVEGTDEANKIIDEIKSYAHKLKRGKVVCIPSNRNYANTAIKVYTDLLEAITNELRRNAFIDGIKVQSNNVR